MTVVFKHVAVGFIATAVAITVAQGDRWVDSLGSGDGSTSGTPTSDLQGAIDAASAGETIYIRGAAGRIYTNLNYVVNKAYLTLTDWEGKPILQPDTNAASILDRVVEIATNGVILRNLRFEIHRDLIDGSDDVVESTGAGAGADNITIDGCEFVMIPGFGGAWNQGSPLVLNETSATNAIVRNCLFKDWDRGDGYRVTMINVAPYYSRIIGNTFTNFSKGVAGSTRYSVISSNRFLNSVNDSALYSTITGGYQGLRDCEISYNIAWNDNGKRTAFIRKGRDGLSNGRIFNNTVYNARGFLECLYYTEATAWDDALICNNLMLSSIQTNILGDVEVTGTNAIRLVTEISHNMWYGGPATLSDDVEAGVLSDNYYIDCVPLNIIDPNDPGFMRPDAGFTPEIMQGYGSGYPSFIGAIEPQPGAAKGTVVLLQ